mgnify:CR=1 FL=1
MNYTKIIIIAVAFFLLGVGWHLLSDNSEQTEPQSTSASVYSDSLPDPERPTITAQKDTVDEDSVKEKDPAFPVGEELAPGTALVKAVVISADFDSGTNSIVVQTEEVLGYGSATSPIAVQQELTVSADRFLKNYPDRKKSLQEGNSIHIVISSQKGLSVGESQDTQKWSLVDLKPNK